MMQTVSDEFSLFRTEVRTGFTYINARFDSLDCEILKLRNDLRSEMKEQGEQLRSEMKEQEFRLKEYIHDGVDAIMNALDSLYTKKDE